jgi:hypothetical protein
MVGCLFSAENMMFDAFGASADKRFTWRLADLPYTRSATAYLIGTTSSHTIQLKKKAIFV